MRDHGHAVLLWESLGFTILAIARKLSDILTVGSSASHHALVPAISPTFR